MNVKLASTPQDVSTNSISMLFDKKDNIKLNNAQKHHV